MVEENHRIDFAGVLAFMLGALFGGCGSLAWAITHERWAMWLCGLGNLMFVTGGVCMFVSIAKAIGAARRVQIEARSCMQGIGPVGWLDANGVMVVRVADLVVLRHRGCVLDLEIRGGELDGVKIALADCRVPPVAFTIVGADLTKFAGRAVEGLWECQELVFYDGAYAARRVDGQMAAKRGGCHVRA